MKIALLKGRFIDGRDRQGAPGTIVINETMARRYFAGEDPIGKVVRNPHGNGEVVGVVGDVKHYGLDSEPRAELFMPAWQQPLNGMALIVRTASGSERVRRGDPRAKCWRSMPSSRSTTSARWSTSCRGRCFLPRISMLLLGAFARVGAAAGGGRHLRRRVAQRDRSGRASSACGWRSARTPASTLRLVLGRSMLLVGGGTVCGLVASFAVTRAIAGLLYDVSPLDPVVFVGVSLLLAAPGFVASLIPARRATRVD